jgi:hypothetical protein
VPAGDTAPSVRLSMQPLSLPAYTGARLPEVSAPGGAPLYCAAAFLPFFLSFLIFFSAAMPPFSTAV